MMILLFATGAVAQDYYVATTGSDSNPGTAAQPWATINHADSLAQPGWTIHVMPGTYTGNVSTHASGTSSARIVWLSDTKWAAKLVGVSGGQAWNTAGAYVDIVNFDISGDANQGIIFGGNPVTLNSRAIGNHVHNLNGADIYVTCNNGTAGINAGTAGNIMIIGNEVDHIANLTSGSCGQGIYLSGANGIAQNNIVNNTSNNGITSWHAANGLTVSNNTIFQVGSNSIVVGSGDAYAPACPPGNDNTKVTNNIIYSGGGYAIVEEGCTGTHNVYQGNLVNSAGSISLQNGLTATNTVSSPPIFVNYQANGTGDYHEAAGSPTIDTCTSNGAPSTDFDGVSRPQGAGYDVGAYEFSTSSAPYPPTNLSATVQ